MWGLNLWLGSGRPESCGKNNGPAFDVWPAAVVGKRKRLAATQEGRTNTWRAPEISDEQSVSPGQTAAAAEPTTSLGSDAQTQIAYVLTLATRLS